MRLNVSSSRGLTVALGKRRRGEDVAAFVFLEGVSEEKANHLLEIRDIIDQKLSQKTPIKTP